MAKINTNIKGYNLKETSEQVEEYFTKVDALQDAMHANERTHTGDISNLQEQIDDVVEDTEQLQTDVSSVTQSVATLNGNASVNGSVDKKVQDAINAFKTIITDDNTINTYKEALDWIDAHGAEYTALLGQVTGNTNGLANLNDMVVGQNVVYSITLDYNNNRPEYTADEDEISLLGKLTFQFNLTRSDGSFSQIKSSSLPSGWTVNWNVVLMDDTENVFIHINLETKRIWFDSSYEYSVSDGFKIGEGGVYPGGEYYIRFSGSQNEEISESTSPLTLADLITTDKSNLISAINELVNRFSDTTTQTTITNISNGTTTISPKLSNNTQYGDIALGSHTMALDSGTYSGYSTLAAIAAAVATLNGNDTVNGSVDKKVKDAIDAFASAITEDGIINTYKEVLDWIASHGADFAALVGQVNTNAGNISTLRTDLTAEAEARTSDVNNIVDDLSNINNSITNISTTVDEISVSKLNYWYLGEVDIPNTTTKYTVYKEGFNNISKFGEGWANEGEYICFKVTSAPERNIYIDIETDIIYGQTQTAFLRVGLFNYTEGNQYVARVTKSPDSTAESANDARGRAEIISVNGVPISFAALQETVGTHTSKLNSLSNNKLNCFDCGIYTVSSTSVTNQIEDAVCLGSLVRFIVNADCNSVSLPTNNLIGAGGFSLDGGYREQLINISYNFIAGHSYVARVTSIPAESDMTAVIILDNEEDVQVNALDARLSNIENGSISDTAKAQLIAEIKQAVIADLGSNVAHYEDVEEE